MEFGVARHLGQPYGFSRGARRLPSASAGSLGGPALKRADLVSLDRARVWHPYTAMDQYAAEDPIVVESARGARLYDPDGRSYLDGNASWWVATLGHAHPRLVSCVQKQVATLGHCALAGIAHEYAARLADALCRLAPPGLTRAFFTDDGSTAVEVAVKMAVQYWQQAGAPRKTRFVALDGAFHGDSVGAASLGGVEVFRRPFGGILFDCVHVPSPEEHAYARAFDALTTLLARDADHIAAVVVEPVVQGSAGMRTYDAGYLRELRALATRHDVLLVFDEVFSGYGRTGPMWGASHAQGVSPDLMCVGKAMCPLLPLGATLASDRVFDGFRGGKDRALMYGHTLCGNPLGTALALEVLEVYRDEQVLERARPKATRIASTFEALTGARGVARTRSLGMLGAADLAPSGGHGGYLGKLGWRVYDEARRRGAYIRPLGDTVYLTPPLNIDDDELDALLSIFTESVAAAVGG